jgi:hypothetical protein
MRHRLIALAVLAAAPAAAGDDGCRMLLRHLPADGVAFRPGVDVRGRPVAAADLAPAPPVLREDTVFIDLSLPVGLFRAGPARRHDLADLVLGVIEIDLASGAVRLDGRPLTHPEADRLAAYCRGDPDLPPLPAHKPMP